MTHFPRPQSLPVYGVNRHPRACYGCAPIVQAKPRPLSACQVAGRALGVGVTLGAVVLAVLILITA